MNDEVADHVKNCPVCGASPHKTAQTGAATTPLPVPAGPNHRVHVDLYGPLKTNESGNKYVLVYTDAFTKMARVSAISDKSAPTVAQAILDIMYTFGVPRQIHSDQGLEFCNQLMKVCLLYTSPSPRDKRQSRMPSSA